MLSGSASEACILSVGDRRSLLMHLCGLECGKLWTMVLELVIPLGFRLVVVLNSMMF